MIRVKSYNVHKNWDLTTQLLSSDLSGVLLLQEPPYKEHIRYAPSHTSALGEVVSGLPISNLWSLASFSRHAAIYVSKSLTESFALSTYSLGSDVHSVELSHHVDNSFITIINTYLDHNTSTVEHVTDALMKARGTVLLAGDFNSHSIEWDPNRAFSEI